MEHIRESSPYGDQRHCQSPTAKQAWDAVCAFARDTVPGWLVMRTVAAIIREVCGGKSWAATGPEDWRLLVERFGGGQ